MSEQEKQKLPSEQKEATGKTAGHKKHASHARHKHRSAARYVSIFFVALILIAGAGIWYGYNYLNSFKAQIQRLGSETGKIEREYTDQREEYASKWKILKQQQDDLSENITALRSQNQHLRKDWLVLEAEYLVKLANHRLLLERDVNTAIAALNAADARLREAGDPGLINVRKVINAAEQKLKQVPQVDTVGLSIQLSTLAQNIETLPLATPDPVSRVKQIKEDQGQKKEIDTWSELPGAIWQDLKNLIIIRDHSEPVKPLLSPEQRFFLVENLRLQLEQARLAMLSGANRVFTERITTAKEWVEKYFDKESPVTKSALDVLQQLAKVQIKPEIPDISNTYQALESYRKGMPVPSTDSEAATPDSTENKQNTNQE